MSNYLIVRMPAPDDKRKKSWRKALSGIDKSKSNGYAFEGDFLQPSERAELPIGSYVLTYDVDGSMKNWYIIIRLYRVDPDGSDDEVGLTEVYRWEGGTRERSWALAVRDEIAEFLFPDDAPAEDNPLAQFSTHDLQAEIDRRRKLQEGGS